MSSLIPVTFTCSICSHEIRGEYEVEDFDYPVFCPKCGRQNQLPRLTSTARTDTSADNQPATVLDVTSVATAQSHQFVTTNAATEAAVNSTNHPKAANPSPAEVPITNAIPITSHSPATNTQTPSRARIAWRFRPPSSGPAVPVRNCVAMDTSGQVIAAIGMDLFALMPGQSGCEVNWKFATGGRIPGSPVVGADGNIYIHSGDGFLHVLNSVGSPARAPTKVGPALGWATPVVDENNRVWISASTGGILRVDANGQTPSRPFFRFPNRFDCTGALRDQVLYIGSEDQFLHAVDLRGERGKDCWSQPDKIGLTQWCINSAIALNQSQIIAVSRDDALYSFDRNGGLVWRLELCGRAIGSPIITANEIIVIGVTANTERSDLPLGQLIAVHSKTGQIAWKVDVNHPVESTPVSGNNGEIYFGDNSGKVHAVNGQGQRLWSESVGAGVRSAGAIIPSCQVVFGLDDGSLVALRCSSHSVSGPWPKLLGTSTNRSICE